MSAEPMQVSTIRCDYPTRFSYKVTEDADMGAVGRLIISNPTVNVWTVVNFYGADGLLTMDALIEAAQALRSDLRTRFQVSS
jgi:hypothetical protein